MKNMSIEKHVIKNSRNEDIFINVLDKKTNDVLVVVHGFDSNKDGSTIKFLRNNMDVSIVSFDLPMHGESSEELLLSNCIDDLGVVCAYIKSKFRCSISLFGSSFGCFVILNYLRRNPNAPFKNVFLKSAAIKMDKVFRDVLIEESMESYQERGYTIKNRNKKMVIPYKFYEELVSNPINIKDFSNRDFYLFHGINDDTALFDDLGDFSASNFHVVKLEANHIFDNNSNSLVVERIRKVLK